MEIPTIPLSAHDEYALLWKAAHNDAMNEEDLYAMLQEEDTGEHAEQLIQSLRIKEENNN